MKKIIITIITILAMIILPIIYVQSQNKKYEESLAQKIQENYPISDLQSINFAYNYYILITPSEIIVLNKKYEQIHLENITNKKLLDLEIIYKNNKLMYEETLSTSQKITYNYYDFNTEEKINTIEMER